MNLDLHRHAVLEASAGTGKTHAIGELVLRLLKEGVALDRILIVTFTEKATGELKTRLRSALEKELAHSPPHRDLLRSAIDNFDQAWIFTLHGFCRRVLLEFHLEQGQDASNQLVHDGDLLEPCLRELQRRTWRQEYGPLLGEVLQISGYDRQQARRWEEQVRELTLKLRADCGQRMTPATIADWPNLLRTLNDSLRAALPRLNELLHECQALGFVRGLSRIKAWLDDPNTQSQPLRTFHDLVKELTTKREFAQGGFPALCPRAMLGQPDPAARLLNILDLLHRLGNLQEPPDINQAEGLALEQNAPGMTGSDSVVAPLSPVLGGEGSGVRERETDSRQELQVSARDADPLTPNPSPPSTGERGAMQPDSLTADPSTGVRGAVRTVTPIAMASGEKGAAPLDWSSFRYQLMIRTISQLQQAVDDFKRQHGLWSFQDMLARVDDALNPARNPRADNLAALLRERFQYGIVDEFQDTDPVQWRILRRIFLDQGDLTEGSYPKSRLFLVGDPKQAIFGFRGADLPTYQDAARAMLEQHRAQDQPLLVNWRSSPELIESLNRLFHDGAWFPADSGIRYLPVQAAPEDERPSRLIADRTGRPALNVIDWRQDQLLSRLRRRHAEFIVAEIRHLLQGGSLVSVQRGQPRPLHAGDICVLVFRRREAQPLLAGLRQAGIPYSFYKQAALYKSEEAEHLRFILEALSQPEHRSVFRKALLTRFFRVAPRDLAENDELSTQHPARRLFDHWLELAGRRQWSALFQSMLEDTGLFFADGSDVDADRSRANYRHLTSQLIQQAYRQNLDLLSLTDWFRQQGNMGAVDEDVQPRETERPRVQIMTIHASKGLEYPIIFLAGGWTQRPLDGLLAYRTPQHELVYDLTNPPLGSLPRKAAERDMLDEQRRLLYVAFTRAMFKLYVPQTLSDGKSWKMKGPIVQLLAPALEKAHFDAIDPTTTCRMSLPTRPENAGSNQHLIELPDSISMQLQLPSPLYSGERGAGGATESPQEIQVSARDTAPLTPNPSPPSTGERGAEPAYEIEGPLVPILDADLFRRGIVIRSFTSLHQAGLARSSDGSNFAPEPPRVEDEDDQQTEADEPDPLRGAVFGEIVHGVLEKIDYELVGQATAPEQLLTVNALTEKGIAAEIDHYLSQLPARLAEDELRALCRQRVAELVWHALHVPLPELGCPLWQIPAKDRLQELSFHYPENEAHAAGFLRQEGFVTGFIDLVVRRQGRYFLIDWKTNALSGYGPEEIARAMEDGGYHLQYRLYLQALVRWLRRSLGPTFDWRRDLGGVYYLFLRGLTEANVGNGVFFHRPNADDLRLERVLDAQARR